MPSFLNRPLTDTERAYTDAARTGDEEATSRLLALLDRQDGERLARLTAPGALAAAALYYATVLGWPVFPLRPGEKRPATAHGFKEATTDPSQVEEWWRQVPAANVGLPTGGAFDVVDIDSAQAVTQAVGAGLPSWESGELIATVMTPRGWHLYVPPTGRRNAAGLMPHVDYRGLGGYVVAPPSVVGGRLYQWDQPPAGGAR